MTEQIDSVESQVIDPLNQFNQLRNRLLEASNLVALYNPDTSREMKAYDKMKPLQ
ncbi:hypothetical protein JCM19239_1617 [Vibrio variabilis]|uniref:Uncharacterized protein n=1 Tax=Vibrio variabilis TaxID=990271 RepID=A0ABQ0JQK5_9VIBR|nr:hypothetical protein JCM19239_1617 [Vibrio variabilis]